MKTVLFLGSNQSGNVYTGGQYNEHLVMQMLAHRCAELAKTVPGIDSASIPASPESADTVPGVTLDGLYRQQQDAVRWLRQNRISPQDALVVNLHSDSGVEPHTGFYWGGTVGGASYSAGRAICQSISNLTDDPIRNANYSAYVFWRVVAGAGYTPVLIEVGSHQSDHDLDFLLRQPDALAKAIVEGAANYLNVPLTPPKAQSNEFDNIFGMYGVPVNRDAAFYKYAKRCWELGDIANLGPALRPEEPGDPYGEPGKMVQFFANAVLVAGPDDGWTVRRALVVQEPQRWFPSK